MRLLPLALLSLSLLACNESTNVENRHEGGVNNPNSPSPPVVSTRIEFRVSGNANSARVRLSNAIDGLTQVTTTLPYVTTITTMDSSMFLSLEATPSSYPFNVQYPFFSVQIFADGKLFREATSNEFLLNTLSINGTWRR